MDFLIQWLGIILITLMAVASPGPDFVIAVRNSVLYSRTIGVMTAIGFGLGVLIHATYCILGIAALIGQSILLFNIIKWIGAAYLLYIGYKSLRSTGYDQKSIIGKSTKAHNTMSAAQALINGFWTNVLNPKATMFFLALFTQIIDPDTPLHIQAIFGLTAAAVTILWFTGVALVLNQQHIRRSFLKMAKWIDRICGGLLIALGIKLAVTKI